MHTFDEIIGILRANFYVCIIYLYILQICILYTTTFGDSSCRSVPIRRRNFRIIPLYDVRERNNIPLHGFANYSIYYNTTTRSRVIEIDFDKSSILRLGFFSLSYLSIRAPS